MIYIQIKGGLGNQMFQYALGKILSKKYNSPLYLDKSFYKNSSSPIFHTPRNFELDIFNFKYKEANPDALNEFLNFSFFTKLKKKLGLNYPKTFREKNLQYNPLLTEIKPPVYLIGYFQSYKYFQEQEEFVRNLFYFPVKKLDQKNIDLLKSINQNESVAIHIRRGDYVTDKKTQNFHGNLKKHYYLNALSEIENMKKGRIHLFFFSDDNEWVKAEFSDLNYPKTFIDHNTGDNSWIDMYLMSNCKHNIIANSSFSWWGAWLNKNSDKIVFAPKSWFKNQDVSSENIIPSDWIRV